MRIIDLSHPLGEATPAYPGDPAFQGRPHATLAADGYRVTEIRLGTHLGTHLDAPAHFLGDGATIEQIPLETLIGPAMLIDVPGEPGALVEPDHLAPFTAQLTPGARIILRSGWGKHWGGPRYWRDYPGLSPAAARWLVARGVALLGFDTPGPAAGDLAEVHRILLGARPPVAIVENLAHLEELPPQFDLLILPLPLVGLDAAPVRAVALVPLADPRRTG